MDWCFVCDRSARARQRNLSVEAVATLLAMGLLEAEAIGRPMCGECFDEFREVLIDDQTDARLPGRAPAVTATLRAALAGDALTMPVDSEEAA